MTDVSAGSHLFVYLSKVHVLLYGSCGHETEHAHVAPLADAVRAVLSLEVVGGIPVGVKYHHLVGACQVQAQTTSPDQLCIYYYLYNKIV